MCNLDAGERFIFSVKKVKVLALQGMFLNIPISLGTNCLFLDDLNILHSLAWKGHFLEFNSLKLKMSMFLIVYLEYEIR